MDARPQTQMPRSALPHNPQRSRTVIWGVALVLAMLFGVGQVITVLAAAPAAIAFYAGSPDMPAAVALAEQLGPIWIGALLTFIDIGIFLVFVWLARRHWIGFAYLPPLLYIGLGSWILWSLLSGPILQVVFGG